MKLLIFLLLSALTVQAQVSESPVLLPAEPASSAITAVPLLNGKVKVVPGKWKITRNHWITGGLVFTAGVSKGFNETLLHHWKASRHSFPDANPTWFNPDISWRNNTRTEIPMPALNFLCPLPYW